MVAIVSQNCTIAIFNSNVSNLTQFDINLLKPDPQTIFKATVKIESVIRARHRHYVVEKYVICSWRNEILEMKMAILCSEMF